ncbi:ATP-binding protein [Nocardia bovistercoris]|uniref:Anti-sigma factor n=1 Tax=Nocardia bovistercoris TaxID=2785916 RepID=A0A931N843_9NOCA|nr:anti-sigma factor [Nocardia bovistercoris]MBH0781388.1 anti-sigma factor [Nocardia bovistercoris]
MAEWTTGAATTIEVKVPAQLEQLAMLRALVETVAFMADFAVDEVTDIRLALDEVATGLILDAAPDTTLDCQFSYSDATSMHVRVYAVSSAANPPSQDSFGWHIVRTLTRSVAATQTEFDAVRQGYPTVVDFEWVRGGTDGR